MEFKQLEEEQHASDEDVLVLSKRYMDKKSQSLSGTCKMIVLNKEHIFV